MKKFYFLAIAAAVTMFSSCSKTPKVIEEPLANPDYTSVTVEGSGKYGVINSTTKKEVLPQIFDHIDYLDNGYFLTNDSVGFLLFNTNGNALIPAQDKITTVTDTSNYPPATSKASTSLKKSLRLPVNMNKYPLIPPATSCSSKTENTAY